MRPVSRAVLTLIVAALIVAVALWRNSPSTKGVDFEVSCERLVVPTAVTLNLNDGQTQIKGATFFGFDGLVSAVAKVDVTIPGQRSSRNLDRFTLARGVNQPLPYLKITPAGALGMATLQLRPGVTLEITDTALRIASHAQSDARLVLQSDRTTFEGSRYAIREVAPRASSLAEFSIAASGPPPGLVAELQTIGAEGAQVRADIAFVETGREIVLLDSKKVRSDPAKAVSIEKSTLRLLGAIDPSVRIDMKSASDLIANRALDLTLDVESGTIDRLAIAVDPAEKGGRRLKVSGTVRATSVQQGGRELLPTWIEQTLATSDWERSIWFVLLGFAAFTLFKAVDRAIGVLLDTLIGE